MYTKVNWISACSWLPIKGVTVDGMYTKVQLIGAISWWPIKGVTGMYTKESVHKAIVTSIPT